MTKRTADAFLVAGATLGGLSIWLVGAIVTYDVVLRFAGMPTLWALEISTYLMIGAATFGGGLAVLRGDHFSVDLVPNALPRRAGRWLAAAGDLASLCLMIFVAYGFWQLIALSLKLDMKSATILRVPLVYPQVAVLAGFSLMALAFVRKLVIPRALRAPVPRKTETP